jgi:hypothetical protein
VAAKGAAWCVSATPDGIRVAAPLLDQVVVEQPDDDQALLQGGVG